MSEVRRSSSHPGRFPLVWFLLGFVICNLSTPIVMVATEGATPVTVCIVGPFWGAMIGQLHLLTIWAVFGPLTLHSRWLLTLFLAVILMASFYLATVLTSGIDVTYASLFAPFLFVPFVMIVAQVPLWCLKLATGGQIVHAASVLPYPATRGRQFTVRDALTASVIVAVSLSLAGSAAGLLTLEPKETWIPLLLVCLFCFLLSIIVAIPCFWAAMIARRAVAASLLAVVAIVVIAVPAWWVAVSLVPGGPRLLAMVLFLVASHVAPVMVIFGTLHVARWCGYTFVHRKRSRLDLGTNCEVAARGAPYDVTPFGDSGASRVDEPLEGERDFGTRPSKV